MKDAMILVSALRDPASTDGLTAGQWTALLTIARAEQLIGTLAHRLSGRQMPDSVAAILGDAKSNAEYQRRSALWEADSARRALSGYHGKTILMKGTAYHAADLSAAKGRHVGDLDIMVAEEDLQEAEQMLLAAGWEWVKEDAYDDAYYRDHMHELPPLIHKERDRMIDVHHTILPKTARPNPDAAAMLTQAVPVDAQGKCGGLPADERQAGELFTFCPADMFIHSAAHLFADGDLAGGLRNLWDMHCLANDFSDGDASFWQTLDQRAERHELHFAVRRAVRLSHHLYGTQIPPEWQGLTLADRLYIRRLTARGSLGQSTRKLTQLTFYIRSHWLRMPPLMLAKHLWTKWRKGS